MQSNTAVNYSNTNHGKNASYPLKPLVKCKTNLMGKHNLFIVGESHIKQVKKDLIIHHLSDKNISLKCKKFDGADVKNTAASITSLT